MRSRGSELYARWLSRQFREHVQLAQLTNAVMEMAVAPACWLVTATIQPSAVLPLLWLRDRQTVGGVPPEPPYSNPPPVGTVPAGQITVTLPCSPAFTATGLDQYAPTFVKPT